MLQSTLDDIRQAIEAAIDGSEVDAQPGAGAGHFTLSVKSSAFAGKPMLEAHRMVYSAIAHLMEGERAPVHAIDRLRTLAP
ncbi:MAG: BolA/IbaG family iron-sulfur metabolism protein [Deltaproteobacteria bacterium]|nr:BolA/IbaG family iron-sulfur metabolism protein [Deltaproteobacteria bacterium]